MAESSFGRGIDRERIVDFREADRSLLVYSELIAGVLTNLARLVVEIAVVYNALESCDGW